MLWRFTFTDPNGGTFQPSEPSGWAEASIQLDRHPDFHSLIESFQSTFQAYGSNGEQDGGRDWLLSTEQTFGQDALITVLVEIDNDEDGGWETLYLGTLGISLFIETINNTSYLLQIVFSQQDFWTKFINRFASQVDIRANQSITEATELLAGTIAPTPYFNLPLPSQVIDKTYQAYLSYNQIVNFAAYNSTDGTQWFQTMQLEWDTVLFNEIDQTFVYSNSPSNPTSNPAVITGYALPFAKFIVAEDGDFEINDLEVTLSIPNKTSCDNLNGKENRTSSTIGLFEVIIQVNSGSQIETTTYNGAQTYVINNAVVFNGLIYYSLANSNTNNLPISSPTWWGLAGSSSAANSYNPSTTYTANQSVIYNGVIYISLAGGNTGNEPDISPTWWARTDINFQKVCNKVDIGIAPAYYRNDGKTISLYTSYVTQYSYSGTLKGLKKNDSVRIYVVLIDPNNFNIVDNIEFGHNENLRALFIWGNRGWDKNNFVNFLGAESLIVFNGDGHVTVDPRFSSLISDSYDPSTDPGRNVATGFPVFKSVPGYDGYDVTTNDAWIVGVSGGSIGSGSFAKPVNIGDVIQASYINTLAGVHSFSTSSPNVVGSSSLYTTELKVGDCLELYDQSSGNPIVLIGQVLSITDNTHLTLAANADTSGGGVECQVVRFWVGPLTLYEGLEPYGNTLLNATFHSQPGNIGNILNKATTLTTNNYIVTNPAITKLIPGLQLSIIFDNPNTGAATIIINGGAAIPIVDISGSALVANEIVGVITTASAANTYAATAYTQLTALYEGLTLVIKFDNANTGAATLNVNGLGAIAILTPQLGAIGAGVIGAGTVQTLLYNGANWIVQLNNGQVGGQTYILDYNGTNFTLTRIAGSDAILPTANQAAQAFLTHDVLMGILDRITDNTGLLYAPYLGNPWTSVPYVDVGAGSLLANLKGLHLRGYALSQKNYFVSAQDWWNGINPILCLGLGYDVVNGQNVITVDQKSTFFNPTMSVMLNHVQNIKRSYDTDYQFNRVITGYAKGLSQAATGTGAPSGIDDPLSQTRNSRLRNIGKPISLLSTWIAASLGIETTRRVGIQQSANYVFDDDTFVIALQANGDGSFTPELSAPFSSITNLLNSTTRYNTRLSPARNFMNWLNLLSGCLQSYLTSVFSFASGQGNYDMTSQLVGGAVINESGNIAPSSTPFFIPELYEIDHYLDWDCYNLIKQNRNLAVGVSQLGGNWTPFFIKSLKFNIAEGTVKLIGWPQTPFTIQQYEPTQVSDSEFGDYYFQPNYDLLYD